MTEYKDEREEAEKIASELIAFKKLSGWTYERISNMMGVSNSSIYNWILKRKAPSTLAWPKIRFFLNTFGPMVEKKEPKKTKVKIPHMNDVRQPDEDSR